MKQHVKFLNSPFKDCMIESSNNVKTPPPFCGEITEAAYLMPPTMFTLLYKDIPPPSKAPSTRGLMNSLLLSNQSALKKMWLSGSTKTTFTEYLFGIPVKHP